jgi:tripartite ATP-independent transporter DctM subunit
VTSTFFILLVLLLVFLGLPLFAGMSTLAIGLFYFSDIDISAVAIEMYRLASSPTILSIPLFTMAGYFLAESKSPARLLQLFSAMTAKLPGSLALVCLLVTSVFTAFTGASGITIVALGGLLYPMLLSHGYSQRFSLGLITTTGSLGLLLPPSLPLILYGIVAKVDIDQLFLAGMIPSILLILCLATYAVYVEKKFKLKKSDNHTTVSFKSALWQARYELPLPLLILGGLYGGFLTTSETATVTLLYCLFMVFVGYKDLSVKKDFVRIVGQSSTLVGAILLILCCALGLTNYLVDAEVPKMLLAFFKSYIHNKYLFLALLNIFLLIVGCLMDIFSAIIVVLPLLLPMSAEYGIHPIHMAMIFLTNLEIGYITPPVGVNLFISAFRFNRSILEMYKVSLPFLCVLLVALLLITYVPLISLALIP